jgi:hypothetical protein
MYRTAYLNPLIALEREGGLSGLSAPGGYIEGIYTITV